MSNTNNPNIFSLMVRTAAHEHEVSFVVQYKEDWPRAVEDVRADVSRKIVRSECGHCDS
jgi:hypothetical protein